MKSLRALRTERGLGIDGLAALAGVSNKTVVEIEHGRSKRPKYRTVRRLADALGVESSAVAEFAAVLGHEPPPAISDARVSLAVEATERYGQIEPAADVAALTAAALGAMRLHGVDAAALANPAVREAAAAWLDCWLGPAHRGAAAGESERAAEVEARSALTRRLTDRVPVGSTPY